MPSWKIALSLALLAGAAQLAAAQTPAQRAADKLNGGQIPLEDRSKVPGGLVRMGPPVTIVPGKWDIKYHWKGVITAEWGFSDGTSGERSTAWADDGSNASTANGNRLPADYPGFDTLSVVTASYTSTGTVTVVCTWVADTSSYDPPPLNAIPTSAPKTMTLVEKPYVLAHQEPKSSASADDGMGDAAVPGTDNLISKSDGHTTTHQVTNNQVTITHSMSAQTNLTFAWDSEDILIAYSAIEDPHKAQISCVDLDLRKNFFKAGDNILALNLRDDDGSMRVDTVVGPPENSSSDWGFAGELYLFSTGFDFDSTNLFGAFGHFFTNSSVDWTVTGGEWAYTEYYKYGPLIIDVKTEGSKSEIRNGPVVLAANVAVKDLRPKMDVTAENNYTIHIHSPFENAKEVGKREFDHDELFPWSESVAAGNQDAKVQVINSQSVPLVVDDGAAQFGMWLGGVGGSGAFALLTGPETFYTSILADMLCNAIGILLMQPPAALPQPTHSTQTASQSAFENAVDEQKRITVDYDSYEQLFDPGDRRIIFDDSDGTTIKDIADDPFHYWSLAVNPTARCRSGVRMNRATIGGDVYDAQGYEGYSTKKMTAPGVGFFIWEFDISRRAGP